MARDDCGNCGHPLDANAKRAAEMREKGLGGIFEHIPKYGCGVLLPEPVVLTRWPPISLGPIGTLPGTVTTTNVCPCPQFV